LEIGMAGEGLEAGTGQGSGAEENNSGRVHGE
jgi:hypothetical protein